MACAKCLEHRQRLGAALKSGNVRATARELSSAAKTMIDNAGANAGRRLRVIVVKRRPKNPLA